MSLWVVQWNLYIKTTLGTNKMQSLYTGGLYMQAQQHGKCTPGELQNVVFISRWSLKQICLYSICSMRCIGNVCCMLRFSGKDLQLCCGDGHVIYQRCKAWNAWILGPATLTERSQTTARYSRVIQSYSECHTIVNTVLCKHGKVAL